MLQSEWRAAAGARSAIIGLAVLFALLATAGCSHSSQQTQAAPAGPIDVEVAQVVAKDVPVYQEWVSQLDGYVNAQIQPKVTGYVVYA